MAEPLRIVVQLEPQTNGPEGRRAFQAPPGGSPPRPANDNWPRPANDNQPRPTASMSRVAIGVIARLLPRLHPYMRAWDAYLLLREMAEQMQGQGTVIRPRLIPGTAVIGPETEWTVPAGWTAQWCAGFNTAAAIGGTPYVFLPGPQDCGVYKGGTTQGGDLTDSDAAITATLGVGAGSNNTIWGPLVEFTPFDKRRQFRGSMSEPAGWTVGDPVPTPVTGSPPEWLPWSPAGLGAPNALSVPRDALGRVQLPGQVPGARNLTWGKVRAIQEVREALELSERLVPGRIILPGEDPWFAPNPAAQPRPDAWPVQRWPEFRDWFPVLWLSGQLEGGSKPRWSPGPKVAYRPVPSSKGREKKLKFRTRTGRWIGSNRSAGPGAVGLSKSLAGAQAAFSGVTEAMDLVENIWEALPRSSRTAGTTATGNRRLDQMLKDLRRDWDRVDWQEAMANVQWNAVEDMAFGALAMAGTAAVAQTGFGGGLVGGGVIQPGNQGLYQSRDTGDVSFSDHPVSRLLDTMRGLQEIGVGYTERDPTDRISRLQKAGLLPNVPQRDAQGWFDTRFENGFPWIVTRPGQRVNPAPPSPKNPHMVDAMDRKLAAYGQRRAAKVAEHDAFLARLSPGKRKKLAAQAVVVRRKSAVKGRLLKKGKANGLLSSSSPRLRTIAVRLLR